MTGFNADNGVMETVKIKQATKKGYAECEVGGVADLSYVSSTTIRGRVQDNGQVSPTLTVADIEGIKRIEKVGQISSDGSQCETVVSDNGLMGTLSARDYKDPKCIIEGEQMEDKIIVAMRGRNPENPSDRTSGIETEQRLEPQQEGICNTLTSVQKDNLVLEARVVGGLGEMKSNKNTQFYQQDRVHSSDGMAMCLPSSLTGGSYTTKGEKIDVARTILNGYHRTNMTGWNGDNGVCERDSSHNYRIRKLTPKECWRLMGFTDEEFEKAAAVNSNTQLYKQAGNSIVVDVLVAIFSEMINSLENKTPKYQHMEQMSLFDYE